MKRCDRTSPASFSNRKHGLEVTSEIRRMLRQQGHETLRRVRCSFIDGTVTLRGIVADEAQRRQAEDIVWSHRSVECVQNRIGIEVVEATADIVCV